MSCDCAGCKAYGPPLCEVCCMYESDDTFRVGGIVFRVCNSCTIRVRRESKRLTKAQTERATKRNLLRDKQVRE